MHYSSQPVATPVQSEEVDLKQSLPTPDNRDDIFASLKPQPEPELSPLKSLMEKFPVVEIRSIPDAAEKVYDQVKDVNFLRVASELSELLFSKMQLSGEMPRLIRQASEEAKLLAGADPKNHTEYVSHYNFMAYYIERANGPVPDTEQSLLLAA